MKDWADEFGDQMAKGVLGDGTSSDWVDSYDQYVTLKEFFEPSFQCLWGSFSMATRVQVS